MVSLPEWIGEPAVTPQAILVALLVTFCLAFLASYFPARRASCLTPVIALSAKAGIMLLPIRQIFQEMASEKIRFALTVLAVAWATLCIAGMLAVGEGIRLGVMKTAQNGNGNLIYLTGGIATIDFGRFYTGKP